MFRFRYFALALLISIGCWLGSLTPVGANVGLALLQDIDLPAVDVLESVTEAPTTAIVRLDGYALFEVAAVGTVSAEDRADEIESRLKNFAQTHLSGDWPPVSWKLDEETNQPIIYMGKQFLMTVTSADLTTVNPVSSQVRAEELVGLIQAALKEYRQERQPAFLKQQLRWAGVLLLGLTVLSYSLRRVELWLQHRRPQFKSAETPATTALKHEVYHREKRFYQELSRRGYLLGQIFIWFGGLLFLLGLFPYTRSWQQPLLLIVRLPLRIIGVVILCYCLIRLGSVLLDRFFLALHEHSLPDSVRTQRLNLRFSTFSQVSKSVLAALIVSIGVLWILSILGLNLAPLLAGAGIIGLALSLASQNLLKDIINGFMILMEDHYGVGDVIVVESVSGFVETMNLRITQLRNEEGRLITIPNGQIGIVQNLSKEWSRVDLQVPVAIEADIDKALNIIYQVANEMKQDPHWQALILDQPELLGVDALDHVGATVRLWIKTLPLKQWNVAREYRRRLKIAFDQAGIRVGVPHQSISVGAPQFPPVANGHGQKLDAAINQSPST